MRWWLGAGALALACAPLGSPMHARPAAAQTAISVGARGRSVPRPGAHDVRQLAFLGEHGCVLQYDGAVRCWAVDTDGHASELAGIASLPPLQSLVIATYAGCGRAADGKVFCWQLDPNRGMLGPQPAWRPGRAERIGLSPVLELSGSAYYVCALLVGGPGACWSVSRVEGPHFGPLEGLGTFPGAKSLRVTGDQRVIACLFGADRTICGEPEYAPRRLPPEVLDVGISSRLSCLRTPAGVRCASIDWPEGLPTLLSAPILPGTEGATSLSVGNYHRCVIARDGQILCWGDNASGEVDPFAPERDVLDPVSYAGYGLDTQLSCFDELTCAQEPNATYHCWGRCSTLPALPNLDCQERAVDAAPEPPSQVVPI